MNRHTIMLMSKVNKEIRKAQAVALSESGQSVSTSRVINLALLFAIRKGFKGSDVLRTWDDYQE